MPKKKKPKKPTHKHIKFQHIKFLEDNIGNMLKKDNMTLGTAMTF